MQPPALRQHSTGQWFTKWGGKHRYFGKDRAIAEELYWESIADWREWRKNKRAAIERQRAIVAGVTVDEIYQRFISDKQRERGAGASEYYTKHLGRFVGLYGSFTVDLIQPEHLHGFKQYMMDATSPATGKKFGPKTINHDLTAIRVMFNWAGGLGLVPPVNLRGVKNLPIGPTIDRTLTRPQVRKMLAGAPAKVRPWLEINYLALLRPSEVVRVVQGQGEWLERGVFVLDRGKMDERASIKRHCLFSARALKSLAKCEPHWSRLDSYSAFVRSVCDHGPKILQKSAAAHLVKHHSATPADVELLLGHTVGRLASTYYHPAWQRLRRLAGQLSL